MQPSEDAPTTNSDDTYLGIDFSGNHLMWRPRVTRSNVWIAEVKSEKQRLTLQSLCTVQQLEECKTGEHPFLALASLLRNRKFKAAGIDAPFSIPKDPEFYLSDNHKALCEFVAGIPWSGDRQFPRADDFVAKIRRGRLEPKNPLRASEEYWRNRGINVRSTLWSKPRGGAPMTAACLTLLHKANRPIWPWNAAVGSRFLVEAFPAAQLCQWKLPYDRYNGKTAEACHRRDMIVAELEQRQLALKDYKSQLLESADALDAVICTFAAIAGVSNEFVPLDDPRIEHEGRIAVHK
jgi:hypothetical protein